MKHGVNLNFLHPLELSLLYEEHSHNARHNVQASACLPIKLRTIQNTSRTEDFERETRRVRKRKKLLNKLILRIRKAMDEARRKHKVAKLK